MKNFTYLFLSAALSTLLLLSGCGKDEPEFKTIIPPLPSEKTVTEEYDFLEDDFVESLQESKQESVISEDLPPQEGMVRNPLTNEWTTQEKASLRPVAVMVPDDSSAIPHYNLSKADILYECLVESDISRLMAVYSDWSDLERVGNVRSSRDYFVYWAFEWDAVYLHAGGPYYINDVIGRNTTHNIDALNSPSGVFYRTTDRTAPQNLYFDGSDILGEMNRLGYPLQIRSDLVNQPHFQFTDATNPNTLTQYQGASIAKKINLANAYPVSKTWFEYNESDGLYYRFQAPSNGAHMDAATGKQLAFKNVLVQFTYHEVRDSQGYLAFQCIDDTRDGWYFTNGRGIHVNWKKTSDYGPTRYYDDNGNEISLNTGKTMICIVQDGDTFSFQN